MSQITVYRRGDKLWEQTIHIRQGKLNWGVDPQREIERATGILIHRYWSVASFMYGLSFAGHEVYEDRRFKGAHQRMVHRISGHPGRVVHAYFFLGLAWGMNRWEDVKHQLGFMPQHKRLNMLEQAGQYYLENFSVWCPPRTLALHLPL